MEKKFFDLSGITIGKSGEVENLDSGLQVLEEKFWESVSGGQSWKPVYGDDDTNHSCKNVDFDCAGSRNVCVNTLYCDGGSNSSECTNRNRCENTTNGPCINASCDGAKNQPASRCIG